MSSLQTRIQQLLDQFVADGTERGVQAALYLDGQLVVDACAGIANVHTGEEVESETLFPMFSTTKGMVATMVHRLAERGVLDYDLPIASLWPEFAAQGKEAITIRHALNHTAGLPLMPVDAVPEDFQDWDAMCRKIAAMPPISAPGERTEYHAVTFGYLVGEAACRAAGRSFSELWRDEVCAPLGVEDEMFCGIPDGIDPTVAWLEEPNPAPHEAPAEPTAEHVPYWLWPLSQWMNKPEGRRSVVPASSGIMTARAVARHYASLIPGGAEGVELLPPRRVQTVLAPQPATQEPNEDEFFLGYAKFHGGFGHWGYGGSVGMANLEQGWAFAFARNQFNDHNPAEILLNEIKGLIG